MRPRETRPWVKVPLFHADPVGPTCETLRRFNEGIFRNGASDGSAGRRAATRRQCRRRFCSGQGDRDQTHARRLPARGDRRRSGAMPRQRLRHQHDPPGSGGRCTASHEVAGRRLVRRVVTGRTQSSARPRVLWLRATVSRVWVCGAPRQRSMRRLRIDLGLMPWSIGVWKTLFIFPRWEKCAVNAKMETAPV